MAEFAFLVQPQDAYVSRMDFLDCLVALQDRKGVGNSKAYPVFPCRHVVSFLWAICLDAIYEDSIESMLLSLVRSPILAPGARPDNPFRFCR